MKREEGAGTAPHLVQLVLEHFQLWQIQLRDVNRLRHVGKEDYRRGSRLGERRSSQPLRWLCGAARGDTLRQSSL